MPYSASIINILIASPSDVIEEKNAIRRAIDDWNAANAFDRKIVLLAMNWETHSVPSMGRRPQAIINKQLVEKCDLLVALFRARIGTPTGEAQGGTVEEIEKHVKAGKPAMVYFSNVGGELNKIDTAQLEAVRVFKGQSEERGLICEYNTVQEFCDKFGRHLAQTIVADFGDLKIAAAPVPTNDPNPLAELEELMPDVIRDLRDNLHKDPLLRQVLWVTTPGIAHTVRGHSLVFAESEEPGVREKLKVLANGGHLIGRGDDFYFTMTEEFVRMLRNSQTGPAANEASEISLEAKKLLFSVAKDQTGQIIHVQGLVQVGGKTFNIENDNRDEARWQGSIDELVRLRYVTVNADGNVFNITDAGYKYADRLKTDAALLEQWPEIALSDDAKRLLMAGVDNKAGINIHTRSGFQIVHAGNQTFGDGKNPQGFARWKKAVVDLHVVGLVEPQGTAGLYAITHDGYQVTERLR